MILLLTITQKTNNNEMDAGSNQHFFNAQKIKFTVLIMLGLLEMWK